jgi:hypothetical protein
VIPDPPTTPGKDWSFALDRPPAALVEPM